MPTARQDELVVERVEDGLVVYDKRSYSAHSLPSAVAAVWELCDGRRSGQEIASELRLDPEFVERALAELAAADLLDGLETPGVNGLTRRRVLARGAGVAAASVVGAPLIASLLVPTSAAAASGASGPTAVGTFFCGAVGENPGGLTYTISATTANPSGSSGAVQYDDTWFGFDSNGKVGFPPASVPAWGLQYGTTQEAGFTSDGLSIYSSGTGHYQFSGSTSPAQSGTLSNGESESFNLSGLETIQLVLSF